MEKLIGISGYAETEKDLTKVKAEEGEFYNVLSPYPSTYIKTGRTEFGDLLEKTDIIGWFENKAELESVVTKPNNGDIYITGMAAPYSRWKAVVRGTAVLWEEDGESEIKIVRKFNSAKQFNSAGLDDDPENYYSIGKTAPFALYGAKSTWECVGLFISHSGGDFQKNYYEGFNIGEIGCSGGLFYIYTEEGWKDLKIIEPFDNYKKHIYKDKYNDRHYSIREGFKIGTLEFFTPKE